MNQVEKIRNQIRRTGMSRRILWFFLIGFFCGIIFYFIFQNSFVNLKNQMENSVLTWEQNDTSFIYAFLQSIWNHGKFFLLLWLLSGQKIYVLYQYSFIVYTGIRQGFLLLFFLFAEGFKGFILYGASLFPHSLVFLPLYLFSFSYMNGNRQKKHRFLYCLFILLGFFSACLLEVKCNLPLMEKLL